jgi:hypothetical protein
VGSLLLLKIRQRNQKSSRRIKRRVIKTTNPSQ